MSYRCSLPSPLQKRSKDYKRLHRSSAGFKLLSFHWLWQEVSQRAEKLLDKVEENSEAQNLQNLPILCNPWIFSAMAMAMSISRTLCVLVYFGSFLILGHLTFTEGNFLTFVSAAAASSKFAKNAKNCPEGIVVSQTSGNYEFSQWISNTENTSDQIVLKDIINKR